MATATTSAISMPRLPPSRKPTARNRPVIAAIRIPVRNRFIVLRSAVSREKDRPLALHEMGGDRPGFKLWRGPRPCHIREMRLKFTTRTPQPRGCVVTPLHDANPPKARQQERPRERLRELGGHSGPGPPRYGEWERKGICVDF